MPEPRIAEKTRAALAAKLKRVGLRTTQPRLVLAHLLFGHPHESHPHVQGHRHVTAEILHAEARAAGLQVSQATIYNTLHRFCEAGLLREVQVDRKRSYFDTNLDDHHHFYVEEEGRLVDIAHDDITLAQLPESPDDFQITGIDVVIRLRK